MSLHVWVWTKWPLWAAATLGSASRAVVSTAQSNMRFIETSYLQPGSLTVWPGGWHFAPPSLGPLLLFPGPKSGSANAGAAEIDRAATARIDASALRRTRPPPRRLHSFRPSGCAVWGRRH